MPPTENKGRDKRALGVRVLKSLPGLLIVVIIIVVLTSVIVAKIASGHLAVGQAVTDQGLFIQVRSLSLYRDRASQQDDLMVDVKLQNKGTDDILVYFSDEGDGDNVVLIGTKFPGTNNPGLPLVPSGLASFYQGQLLPDTSDLQPGTTMEGLVFFAAVQNGQKATSIEFWHAGPQASSNIFDWPIPQEGVQYLNEAPDNAVKRLY